MFETRGNIDREILYELSKYTIGGRKKKLLFGAAILCSIFSIMCVMTKNYLLVIISFIGAISLIAEYYHVRKRIVEMQMQRNRDMNMEFQTFHSSFENEGIQIFDYEEKVAFTFPYDKFLLFKETAKVYALFTESYIYVVVFKDQLTGAQQKELLEFLKNKLTKIKQRK